MIKPSFLAHFARRSLQSFLGAKSPKRVCALEPLQMEELHSATVPTSLDDHENVLQDLQPPASLVRTYAAVDLWLSTSPHDNSSTFMLQRSAVVETKTSTFPTVQPLRTPK
jgi:hypothetical protein